MKKLFIYIMTYTNIIISVAGLNCLMKLSCENFGKIIGYLIVMPFLGLVVSYSVYLMTEKMDKEL